MNDGNILLWGFVATVLLTTIMSAAQWLGLSRMSVPLMLGSMLAPSRDWAMLTGFAMHMMLGWAFALLYAAAFESVGLATWWFGAAGGLLHGLFVLVALMPILPIMHPRMATERHGPSPTRRLQPPGFLALHYGRRTPIVAIVAHLAYGATLGAFYTLAN